MLKENEKYILTCEEMNNFGNSVCHMDKMVIFVNGGIEGETVEAEIKKVYSDYATANATKIVVPSNHRVTPECVNFQKCGGCVFSHIDFSKENEVKSCYVKNTLKKFGIDAEIEQMCAPVSQFYRNKVVLFYENGSFGYMAPGTNKVVPHAFCLQNEKIFDDIAKFTAKELNNTTLRALFLRKSSHTSARIMVCPIFKKNTDIKSYARHLQSAFPNVSTVIMGVLGGRSFVLEKCEFKNVLGNGYIEDEICGLKFAISPKSFYQINHNCAEKLYEKVVELVDATEQSVIADLFCGTGTMGIIIAKRTGAQIYGVEIEPSAIKDARHNAKLNDVKNIEFFEGDAKDFDKKTDVCIIDPPRKGCSDYMISTLNKLLPQKIVYVSCNPDTLARDIKRLSENYEISTPVYTFNMFPRTGHVESVVCLTRK